MSLRRPSIWAVAAFAVGLAAPLLRAQAAPGDASQLAAAESVPQVLTSGEWSGIRGAYEANRHAAFAVDGGYNSRNSGQQLLTRFDGCGFSVKPDAGGWMWGLQLRRYGFAGRECAVSEPTQVSAAGQRVAYDWDDTLREWYVNDTRGLEHGYTVHQRPPQEQAGLLTFTLAVRGGLAAQVHTDGRGVNFVNGDGATLLTYTGLSVLDADGQVLLARFESLAEGLLLTVDERGAAYPLTIDPVVQQAYLKASNTEEFDMFGPVSVSGDTVVVGAPHEASNATGVNGNQNNNSATYAGAAYVFVRSGTGWTQQAYLKASNTGAEDVFGASVSVSGDTIVVGARQEPSGATGVNGDQLDNSAAGAGSAYVFVRSGTTWAQQAYIKASNTGANDRFGASVSVSGDTLVVGAPQEASGAGGVNGDQLDDSAVDAGAAYAFVREGTNWSQQAYLKASNAEARDQFGLSVAVSGETVLVGAFFEGSGATGVNGDQANNNALYSGAAYVFVRNRSTWSQQAYLKASNSDPADHFGIAVAVSGNTAVVGAMGEDSAATGVNGNQNLNGKQAAGAAYVFVRSGTDWSQQAYLKASNSGAFDQFGDSVAVSGDTVVIGAAYEDSFVGGVNGDQSDNSAGQAGAAYVFLRVGTSWSQKAYLKASNPGPQDYFGNFLAVSGDTVLVGAWGEDSNATGVNGDQSNNGEEYSGAAYVFDLENAWTDLGSGLAGSDGVPALLGAGELTTGSTGVLTLSGAAPTARTFLFISLSSTPSPFMGGTLVPVPVSWGIPGFTSWLGTIARPFHWPDGIPSGTEIYFQYAVRDVGAVQGTALSNAVRANVP